MEIPTRDFLFLLARARRAATIAGRKRLMCGGFENPARPHIGSGTPMDEAIVKPNV